MGAPAATPQTPLPKAAMAVVFLIQISEALGGFALFPFVVFMLRDLGVSERNLGFYSGLLGASFFIGQVFSSYHWGRLADRYGCRACLVFGGLAASFSSAVFGFVPNVTWAVIARVASGLLNGTIGIIKSHVSQITDATNRPTAFSLFPVGFGIGIVSASYLGGALARPADSWPGVFGSEFWETYPYALPLLVCAVYQFLTSLLACAVLRDAPRTAAYDAVGAAAATSAPVWRRRGPGLSCAAYALLAGAQILFDELFPLYARGCLEWKPPRIGRFLALGGGSLLIGSFAAPHVLRLSSGNASRVFVVCNLLNVPLGVVVPALSSFAGLFPVYELRVTRRPGRSVKSCCWSTRRPRCPARRRQRARSNFGCRYGGAGTLGGGASWSGRSARARRRRRGGAPASTRTCPTARAFLVVAAIAAACARCRRRRRPVDDVDGRDARTPTRWAVFSPSSPSEKEVKMVRLSLMWWCTGIGDASRGDADSQTSRVARRRGERVRAAEHARGPIVLEISASRDRRAWRGVHKHRRKSPSS